MRRAEWRRRADDPTTLLGWWWRGLVENHWPRVLLIPAMGASIIAARHFDLWPFILTLGSTLALVFSRNRKHPDPLKPLLPIPAPEGQFRTSVKVLRNGLVTGRDEMAVIVVNGWLYAEGVRSCFSVRRQDVREMGTGSDGKGWLLLTEGSEIRLAGLRDPARIVLERWRCRPIFLAGEPTLPPAAVHSQEFARCGIWALAGLVGFAFSGLAYALRWAGGFFHDAATQLTLAILWVGLAIHGAVKIRWLTQIDRKAKQSDGRSLPRTSREKSSALR